MEKAWSAAVEAWAIKPMEGQFSDAEDEPKVNVANLEIKDANAIDTFEKDDDSNAEYDYEASDEFDEDYDYWDENIDGRDRESGVNVGTGGQNRQNGSSSSAKVTKFQPTEKVFTKFVGKINIDKYQGPKVSDQAQNKVFAQNRKEDKERYRVKDKSDRATIEQVMDPRTRMILFKLLNRGFISEINGCISTGKEANVYHCTSKPNEIKADEIEGDIISAGGDRAIKIYKTSILVFKDRDKYVSGEFRFRSGYAKKNPRKMVRTWAEKEMRNLTRMHNAGIPCPKPILLRSHVLLMEFIGTEGWPAPRLQDVDISEIKARELYWDLSLIIRKMYHQCKLVHGDLSEFNLLYHEGKAQVIDVSQSVEHDHPHALEFLRKDIHNVNEFFRKKKVNVLTVKELFDFVVNLNIEEGQEEAALEKLNEKASLRTEDERSAQEIVEAEVFKQIFIPRKLMEVDFSEAEKAIARAKQVGGSQTEPAYQSVTGVQLDQNKDLDSSDDDEEEVDKSVKSDLSSTSTDENNEGSSKFKDSHRPRNESPNSRKERKQALKAETAEKRKSKIKKHVKKRKEKATTTKKK